MTKAGYMNLGGVTLVGNAAITAATDELTITAHGLADGDLVTVDALVGGGAELRAGTEYVVRNPTTDTFQLSAPAGAAPFDFTADGTCDVYLGVPSYSAVELRRLNAIHLHPGSSDRLGAREGVRPHSSEPVTVAATTYTVAEGLAVVYPRETSTSAPYVVEYAAESAALNPADGTNPRLDGIDLQVQDDDEDGTNQRRARIVYVPGTPASSPTAPAVTNNSLRLATIRVPQTGAPDPDPEVESLAQYAMGAAVLPIRTTAERPTTGLYNGLMCWRQDTKQLEVWDGSAWIVIATAGGYQYLTTVRFTSSGSFTKASYPGLRAVMVQCQAGGGGGGSAVATGVGEASCSGGGGGGEWSQKWVLAASLASSETVTIGAGGAGGTGGGNGTVGGNTSFGSHCSAIGGDGGFTRGATTTYNAATGGQGGTGGTGDFRIRGGGGSAGTADERGTEGGTPGTGGGSRLAGAARGSRGSGGITGDAGNLYGGGGCGAVNDQSSSARAGAAGAAGVVILDLYV